MLNGAINEYFEDGRVRFRMEHLAEVAADSLSGFVIARYTVEYLKPLFFPGSVDIGLGISRIGGKSYTLVQGLFRDGECIATSESVTVTVDESTGQSINISDPLRAALGRFLVES